MAEQTGVPVSSQDAWCERNARRRKQDAFTKRLAAILEVAGVSVYRDTYGAATVGLVTGLSTPAQRQYRQVHFLPSVAATLRAGVANALELYITTKAPFARYAVMTTGPRCELAEVRDRIIKLSRKVSRWHHQLCVPLGIDVLFRSAELTIDDALTFHVHANVIFNPTHHIPKRTWKRFLKSTRAMFGAHWQDNGRLDDVREVVKYIVKGDDLALLVATGDDQVVELYHQLHGLHLVQSLGGFRTFIHRLVNDRFKIVPIYRAGRRRLALVKRPPAHHRDGRSNAVGAVNQVYSINLPSAAFTRFREPVIRVGRLDIETLWNDPNLRRRAYEALRDWHHNGAPDPRAIAPDGRSPFQVHTDRETVGASEPGPLPGPARTAAENPKAPRAPP